MKVGRESMRKLINGRGGYRVPFIGLLLKRQLPLPAFTKMKG